MTGTRIFLLSPASCHGERARLLTREGAGSDLARRLRGDRGAPIGEVFSFLSGLYFRGKLAYARAFARPPEGIPGVLVITPTRGLVLPETHVTLEDLLEFAEGDVDSANERYRGPFERHARALVEAAGDAEFVLLGSVATRKYLDVLQAVMGERLRFPLEFVGRGDMSRGGLMLRCVDDDRELTYAAVPEVPLRGSRPPRLPRRQ